MTRGPDGSRGAGRQGLVWSVGADRVRAMIAAGDIDQVVAEVGLAAAWDALTKAHRHSVLHPLMMAATAETGARRLAKALETLRSHSDA